MNLMGWFNNLFSIDDRELCHHCKRPIEKGAVRICVDVNRHIHPECEKEYREKRS